MIVDLDSTSFPLCSDYTLRKPVSLPVQLEFGRIQELQGLAEIWPIIGYHLPFQRSHLVESLLKLLSPFHSWEPLSTGHISIGPITALLHKLNTRIFRTYMPVFQCLSEFLKYKSNNLILTSKSVVFLLCVKMRNPVEVQDFLSSLLPCF